MATPIIEVRNLSKLYSIGRKSPYGSLREEIMGALAAPFKRLSGGAGGRGDDHVWALKDVSFDVEEGDVLGIIGRNGAGKSTLLKILSRITEPTEGRVTMRGRVASLLEVGTGFHPELTGRENIFLNGALLGMTKREIKAKFDEIVAFSEIEKFLDTPVKRYSSGMYVRLAFAVAAHLEPEILIIDEVLAVGDTAFQKKCLGKMGEVAKGGRTVLFVSHNMAAIENFCNHGVVLERGSKAFQGAPVEAINFYLKSTLKGDDRVSETSDERKGEGNLRVTRIDMGDDKNEHQRLFPVGASLRFQIHYSANKQVRNPRVIIGVYNLMNEGITRFDTYIAPGLPSTLPQKGVISCKTEQMNLASGSYFINIAFFCNDVMEDYVTHAKHFDIVGTDYFGTGKIFTSGDEKLTKVLVRHKWGLYTHDNA